MTREQLKKIAKRLAKNVGLINLSRVELCREAKIPDGSFIHVMGCTFTELLDELRAEGIGNNSHAVNKKRVNPELRKENILNAAIELAKAVGYYKVTRDDIAERAGVSMGLVSRYFGNMHQLRKAIMRSAVKQDIPEIVAQGIVNGDSFALKAPPELKNRAADFIANL